MSEWIKATYNDEREGDEDVNCSFRSLNGSLEVNCELDYGFFVKENPDEFSDTIFDLDYEYLTTGDDWGKVRPFKPKIRLKRFSFKTNLEIPREVDVYSAFQDALRNDIRTALGNILSEIK